MSESRGPHLRLNAPTPTTWNRFFCRSPVLRQHGNLSGEGSCRAKLQVRHSKGVSAFRRNPRLYNRKQVRSDNDASELDILGHYGTIRKKLFESLEPKNVFLVISDNFLP